MPSVVRNSVASSGSVARVGPACLLDDRGGRRLGKLAASRCSTLLYMRSRFDPSLLDPESPFEIDERNRPHFAKHAPYTEADLLEAWADPGAIFLPAAADGPADWLLVAAIQGEVIQAPLAPPDSVIRLSAGRSGSTGPRRSKVVVIERRTHEFRHGRRRGC